MQVAFLGAYVQIVAATQVVGGCDSAAGGVSRATDEREEGRPVERLLGRQRALVFQIPILNSCPVDGNEALCVE